MISREDKLKRLQSGYWDNAPQKPEPKSMAIRKSAPRAVTSPTSQKRELSDEAASLIATVLKDFLRSST